MTRTARPGNCGAAPSTDHLTLVPVAVVLGYVAPERHIAVLSIAFIAHDGETNWMEGVQLLAIYVILALGFYFLP